MINELFGISVTYKTWDKQSYLPLYISDSYDFYFAYIDTLPCLMLIVKEELAPIPSLKKQIKRIQEIDNIPIVFVLASITSYRRKNLIENRISFITDKQAYLPFMGTFLTEQTEVKKEVEKFMFSTQQLVLLYFYNGKQQLYMAEATKTLPYTAMTLSRCVKQLEATGLFIISKDGVNKVIKAKYDNAVLFEKVRKYCSSPIRSVGYIESDKITKDMVLSGECVLSEKTMLNENKIKTYAIYHKLFDKKQLMNELVNPDKQVRLELWEYNPKQFSNDNMADPLSVILSFENKDNDERIEEAIDELIQNKIKVFAY